MDWNAIGAVGELVGGVAVIATIGYLAVQVGQAKASMKANIRQQASILTWNITESIYNSPYMPMVFLKIHEGEELSREEAARFFPYLSGLHRHWECLFFLSKEAQISQDILNNNALALGDMGWFKSSYGRQHWQTVRESYEPDYREWVDEVLRAHN